MFYCELQAYLAEMATDLSEEQRIGYAKALLDRTEQSGSWLDAIWPNYGKSDELAVGFYQKKEK